MASPEQVQSNWYFPGPWDGLGIGRAGTLYTSSSSTKQLLKGQIFHPSVLGFLCKQNTWEVHPAHEAGWGKGTEAPREDAGSSLLGPGHPSPHWEHTQLTLGKGLPGASQIPRDGSSGSHRFRTQAAPPCCLSFSAMYHAIAIKMQSFYSLHNFNYF